MLFLCANSTSLETCPSMLNLSVVSTNCVSAVTSQGEASVRFSCKTRASRASEGQRASPDLGGRQGGGAESCQPGSRSLKCWADCSFCQSRAPTHSVIMPDGQGLREGLALPSEHLQTRVHGQQGVPTGTLPLRRPGRGLVRNLSCVIQCCSVVCLPVSMSCPPAQVAPAVHSGSGVQCCRGHRLCHCSWRTCWVRFL